MSASPAQVWTILADATKYSDWVVGARRIRGQDGLWPAEGSRFHHSTGIWLLQLRDSTSVLEIDEPRRLVLEARVRPLGRARIELQLFDCQQAPKLS